MDPADVGDVHGGPLDDDNDESGEPPALSAMPRSARSFPAAPTIAFHGIFGDLVMTLDQHTEADPVALLLQTLTAFGSIVGRGPFFVADGALHYMNLFLVLVGATSKSRKGTSWAQTRNIFAPLDPDWRLANGLSSGEGLIQFLRNDAPGAVAGSSEGKTDKRLLVVEPEFARVLKVVERENSILSAVLREAWDTGTFAVMVKTSPAFVTDGHVSVIGHITQAELTRCLTATQADNGFGNRFLWACVKRSKRLPEGGSPAASELVRLRRVFDDVVRGARDVAEIRRTPSARSLWSDVYGALSEGYPGRFGAMTGRAEAQVMRLAAIFALGDGQCMIDRMHLEAALDLWDFCRRSAAHIFGDGLGDALADNLLAFIRRAGDGGVLRMAIIEHLQNNVAKADIDRALSLLLELNLITRTAEPTGHRPRMRYRPRATPWNS